MRRGQKEIRNAVAKRSLSPFLPRRCWQARSGARAQNAMTYPDWSGQWDRIGNAGFDPDKANGLPQAPPLTAN